MKQKKIPTKLVHSLRTAQRIVVLTGAGISAESGIPTFRAAQTGLWAQYDPIELATPQAFEQNPRLVWEWYAWLRELVAQASPNLGHETLVQMQTYLPELTIVTQNIDGLHQEAGSQSVIELHGSLSRNRCVTQGHLIDNALTPHLIAAEIPPLCPHCGGKLRPDVVWFGESLPIQPLHQALTATHQCDWFFSIGTSSLVYPAAGLPLEALQCGAQLVEINPQKTPLTPHVHFALYGQAGQILSQLVESVWKQ